jgi:hypothetical protein
MDWTDGVLVDLGPPLPDSPGPACDPVGYKPLLIKSHASGDWTVALEPQSGYKKTTIADATSKEAAAALDYDVNGHQVNITGKLSGTVTVRDKGRQGTSHDGFSVVRATTLELELAAPATVTTVRHFAMAGILQRQFSGLSSLPPTFGIQTSSLVLRLFTLIRNDGRVIFLGAVTDRANDESVNKQASTIALDLATGTGLAKASRLPHGVCDTQSVTSVPKNKVEIVWVIDESNSMQLKRDDIADNAAAFFVQLQQTGLDFRMGVTNVCSPNGSHASAVGKFCSTGSISPDHNGGQDRFLLPSEQATFSACVRNPPGLEMGSEYGLVNAREAVERHLPRAKNSPSKIRPEAQLVIIVVTDEGPQSVKNVIGWQPFGKCSLTAADQALVDSAVAPYLDLFSGASDPETKVDYFQVIGGTCSSTGCTYPPDVAHGYSEVAQQLAGQVHDVCQQNLSPSINTIISSIVASSSPLRLSQVPIATSLKLSLDGAVLQRSKVNGFTHVPGTKLVLFTGDVEPKVGSSVVASYQLW